MPMAIKMWAKDRAASTPGGGAADRREEPLAGLSPEEAVEAVRAVLASPSDVMEFQDGAAGKLEGFFSGCRW
jgi:hypothetical protein